MNRRIALATLSLLSVAILSNASADELLSDNALQALGQYVEADLRRDAEHLVAAWPPKHVQAYGGHDSALESVLRGYQTEDDMALRPSRVELSEPRVYHTPRNIYAAIRGVGIARGFPSDIQMRRVYILASEDSGKTWKIVEWNNLGCTPEKDFAQLFPDAPRIPVEALSKERKAVRLVITNPKAPGS
jgi:hypothetical protein